MNGIIKMWFLEHGVTFEVAIIKIIAVLIIIFGILPLREYLRCYVAFKLGDPTAKLAGRMRLNPIIHFDMFGAICLLIFDFGWARPIPINENNFKNSRKGLILTSLTGLTLNLSIAIICGFWLNSMILLNTSLIIQWLKTLSLFLLVMNVSLAVLNLVPLPGFDGFAILKALIQKKFSNKFVRHQSLIMISLAILGFIGFFNKPASIIINAISRVIRIITSLPFVMYTLL